MVLPVFFRFSPHLLYNTTDKLGTWKYTQIYAVVPFSGKHRVTRMRVIGSCISNSSWALSKNAVGSEYFLLFMVDIWTVKSESSQFSKTGTFLWCMDFSAGHLLAYMSNTYLWPLSVMNVGVRNVGNSGAWRGQRRSALVNGRCLGNDTCRAGMNRTHWTIHQRQFTKVNFVLFQLWNFCTRNGT